MSNTLTKAAQKVRWLVDSSGVRRDLRPSERLVLLALADDARDALGGRSRLGTAEIRARTGCSERMVRYAYRELQAGGHITREDAEPGAVAVTVVHPLPQEGALPRAKRKISRQLARKVMERDAYRCVTCGTHMDLQCDHIIPESRGGPTTLDNLQTMCGPCNLAKGARNPDE